MNEQLPPEGRLTDDEHARMRAGLMAAVEEPVRRTRPWSVPAAAAAAVALVAAGVTVVGLSLGGDDGGAEGTPAGQGTSAADQTATPSEPPTDQPVDSACVDEVADRLTGAEVVDAVPYDTGTTYLFATEEKWVVCDTWAMVDGGPPTVTSVRTFGQPLSKQLLLVSQNFSMNEADGAQFFAAGARIPGVDFIQFSFPDGTEGDGGHLVDATMTDHMWVMQYLPPEPPRRAWTTPVKVVATLDDGVKAQYFLADVDLCAQVNHGC